MLSLQIFILGIFKECPISFLFGNNSSLVGLQFLLCQLPGAGNRLLISRVFAMLFVIIQVFFLGFEFWVDLFKDSGEDIVDRLLIRSIAVPDGDKIGVKSRR